MDVDHVLGQLQAVADDFATDRTERLQRRHLESADFQRLAAAGFLASGLPRADGGPWGDLKTATRPIAEMIRTIARGDPSVALVATMHAAVLFFWLLDETAPAPWTEPWQAQRDEIFAHVRAGHWWGTVASEPGSGGDLLATKTRARPAGAYCGFSIASDSECAAV